MSITRASTFKLTYFPADGRALATRLAAHVSGLKLENAFVGDDFRQTKDELYPYGQVPVLEVEGLMIAQSSAILRLVGKVGGLYPTDLGDAAKVDEIMAALEDTFSPVGATMRLPDEDKKKAAREDLLANHLPRWLGALNRRLTSIGGKYCIGDTLTIADFPLLAMSEMLKSGRIDHVPTDLLDGYPKLKEVVNNIKSQEKVAQYYEERTKAGRNY